MHVYPFCQALTARSGNGYHLMLHSPLFLFPLVLVLGLPALLAEKKVVYLSILRIVSSDGERGARSAYCIQFPFSSLDDAEPGTKKGRIKLDHDGSVP